MLRFESAGKLFEIICHLRYHVVVHLRLFNRLVLQLYVALQLSQLVYFPENYLAVLDHRLNLEFKPFHHALEPLYLLGHLFIALQLLFLKKFYFKYSFRAFYFFLTVWDDMRILVLGGSKLIFALIRLMVLKGVCVGKELFFEDGGPGVGNEVERLLIGLVHLLLEVVHFFGDGGVVNRLYAIDLLNHLAAIIADVQSRL